MAQLKHTLNGGGTDMPDGVRVDAGSTVPSNGAVGYKKGSLWIDTDGTTGSTLYVNEGDETSANFNVVNTTD